jgi:hypothetical protein
MKRLIIIVFIVPLLMACPRKSEDERTDTAKAFRENNYDFPAYRKTAYKNIKFRLPESFEFDYGNRYCYKSSSLNRRDFQLGIIFTVERFTEDDLESELMADYMIEDDLLNGFHDAYARRRYESLYEATVSFKKDLKKGSKFKGIIQTIGGKSSDYSEEYLYYVMATVKAEDEYYVFQFITQKEMMDYVYDDFEHILASIRKK